MDACIFFLSGSQALKSNQNEINKNIHTTTGVAAMSRHSNLFISLQFFRMDINPYWIWFKSQWFISRKRVFDQKNSTCDNQFRGTNKGYYSDRVKTRIYQIFTLYGTILRNRNGPYKMLLMVDKFYCDFQNVADVAFQFLNISIYNIMIMIII